MRSTAWTVSGAIMALVCVTCLVMTSFAAPPGDAKKAAEPPRVSVETARERAKLTHNIYSATLDVVHHHYFRGERASVPARAMEDVFKVIAKEEHISAKWIAVNAKAMSIDHKPEGDFEKQAVKAIVSGQNEYERVEDGVYRRAVGISLMNRGCLGCHLGFGATGQTKRFAGLVISIPVKKD